MVALDGSGGRTKKQGGDRAHAGSGRSLARAR